MPWSVLTSSSSLTPRAAQSERTSRSSTSRAMSAPRPVALPPRRSNPVGTARRRGFTPSPFPRSSTRRRVEIGVGSPKTWTPNPAEALSAAETVPTARFFTESIVLEFRTEPSGSGTPRRTAPAILAMFPPASGPYTTVGRRTVTAVRPRSPKVRRASSAASFERPYGSTGAGTESSSNGVVVVRSPFTLIELMKTNRLTPASSAAWARATVGAVFTRAYSASTSAIVSFITCTRAARWMIASAPSTAADQSDRVEMSPTSISSTPASPDPRFRTSATTSCPRRCASLTTLRPTNPVAPVT